MKIDLFCIGTPAINGDAIGPLIGSMLSTYTLDENIRIIGSVEDPVTKSSYERQLSRIRADALVIAIDASVGGEQGTYTITTGSIEPGAALNSKLLPVGHVTVRCYTGETLLAMIYTPMWIVMRLAYVITTELADLLSTNKIKGLYRHIYI